MRLFIAIAALLISGLTQAEPTVTTVFKHYDIFPKSKSDLRPAMGRTSPIKKNGKTYKGHTRWKVRWSYKWYKKDGSCSITSVNTTLKITYTMPHIAENHEVAEPVSQYFDDYYASLLEHEKGHMASGLCAARDIEKAILSLAPSKSCTRLSDAANAAGSQLIKKYGRRDKEYDRITEHGKTQSHLNGSSSSSADCSLSASM